MKSRKPADLAALIIWLLPLLYLANIYASLPKSVPLHFGIDGHPDKYGSKSEMVWFITFFSAVPAGIYFLLKYLPKIDPKKTVAYSSETFHKISILLVIFFAALEIFIIKASLVGSFSINKFLFPVMGLFFAYLGNLMHSIKSNYFVGIRTPWTLENEDNWRATHRLGGKIWFAGGICLTLLTLFLDNKYAIVAFISITVIIAVIPIAYSFIYFKKHSH